MRDGDTRWRGYSARGILLKTDASRVWTLAKTGQPYEQYQPAYEYGRQLAGDQRYQNREWTVVEPDARKSFEQCNPGKWTQFKDAVQCGYNQSRKVAPRP